MWENKFFFYIDNLKPVLYFDLTYSSPCNLQKSVLFCSEVFEITETKVEVSKNQFSKVKPKESVETASSDNADDELYYPESESRKCDRR